MCTKDAFECTDDICNGGACTNRNKHESTLCTDDICMAGTCKHPNKADCVNCGANGQNKCINGSCTPRTCNITPDPIVGCPGSMVTVPMTVTCTPTACDATLTLEGAFLPQGWSISGTGNCTAGSGSGTLNVTIPTSATPSSQSFGVLVKLNNKICAAASVAVTVDGLATLTLTPSRISATTNWTGLPTGANISTLTVVWDPPDCVGRLEIVDIVGTDGYNPPDQGMLDQMSDTEWKYTAFNEPITQKCPKDVLVSVGAFIGDNELARVSILVPTVHRYFTQGSTANFLTDYNYISWKYATVLATTGGAFAGPPTISTSTLVPCGLLGTLVTACTHANDTVDFGTSVFTQSENATVSTIGHELAHTVGMFNQSECTAYTWEVDHAQQTYIFQCDTQYLRVPASEGEEVKQQG